MGSCQFVRKTRRGLAAKYVFVRVVAAGYLLVPELVLGVSTRHFEFGYAIDYNTEAVDLIANRALSNPSANAG